MENSSPTALSTAPPGRGPNVRSRLRRPLRTLAQSVAALGLCLLVLGSVFDLRSEARTWPYAYRGDTMFYHLIAKSVVDHGWFLDVPLLGAPHTLNLRDVPTSDNNLHVLLLRLLALTGSDYPVLLNTFFLLTFPLVFLCAFWVLRHFGLTWWTSASASLLYAFAPFHFMRGEHHLFLSAYWPIPLAVLVALWVSMDGLRLTGAGPYGWRRPRVWLSGGVCLVLAASGAYYAFFACFFLLVAGVTSAARQRQWRGLWPAVALIALICGGVVVNLWPSVAHFHRNGSPPVMQRAAGDADSYGLRIAQLLLPVDGHRLTVLDQLKREYTRRPLVNENNHISLGLAGAAGFVGLLWWFFFRKPSAEGLGGRDRASVLHHLSILNVAGVLFATIGGFGSLVAFFGFPQIRAYNRIGVFLSFFALFAVALWVDGLARRYAVTRKQAVAFGSALAVATGIALLDQVSPTALPDYGTVKAQFASDAAFVRAVERTVPHGARIFQLPFTAFPESHPAPAMQDYDLLRGYLHSNHLRWSYGTVRGREANAWFRHVATLPVDRLVETLAWAGFSGIAINRDGLPDRAAELERELRGALGGVSVLSPDNELAFYDLTAFGERLAQGVPPGERDARREAALHPPLAAWGQGFSDQESAANRSWRWGGSDASMTLINQADRAQRVLLEMSVVPNERGSVRIESSLFGEPVHADRDRSRVERDLVLPPGRHQVRFASSAPPANPPNDFRELVFAVQDFRLTPLQSPASLTVTPLAGNLPDAARRLPAR